MSDPCAEETPTRVIFNPTSGGAQTPEKLRDVPGDRRLDRVRTEHLGDAREAARERRGLLVVVGGDGALPNGSCRACPRHGWGTADCVAGVRGVVGGSNLPRGSIDRSTEKRRMHATTPAKTP